jgi:hypothetical protein
MRTTAARTTILTGALAAFVAASLAAAEPTVLRGADEIRLVKKDVSKPLREYPPRARPAGVKMVRKNHVFTEAAAFQPDGALQTYAAPGQQAPAAAGQFEGVGEGINGYSVCCVPPDTVGDVGPNHYVQSVNIDYAVFSKSGSLLYGPAPNNTVWSGFGGACEANNDGDPIVLYDQFADRWIISQFVAVSPYKECIAVSTTGDPTGSWHRYEYDFGSTFPDYPKLGIWPTEDALFVTYNMFGRVRFAGPRVCAYQRSKLYAGQTNTGQCFSPSSSYHSFLPADLDGSTLPPAGTDGYFVNRYSSTLLSWRANIDWTNAGNSTFTGPSTVGGVASYTTACSGGGTCIPQAGTNQQLDSLGDRLMHRAAYRVFPDHHALVVNHSVVAANATGIRWYELRPSGSGLSVHQQGTYSPDSTHRWMGSVAMDGSGNLAVGYSASSSSINPGIRQTGRLASDPLGTLQAESSIFAGSGSQTSYSRWGDYSSINVDPVDDCTFWYTTEYLGQTGVFNWSTRVASFKFSSCSGGGGCTPTEDPEVSCTDGLDNDCDGFLDGDDSDCQATCTPTETPEASCSDGQDNDCDGFVDLDDSDCAIVGDYTLTASGYKVKGVQRADLTWSGATGASVDVYRDGVKITTTANDGAHTDVIGKKGGGSYVYKVCDAGTTTCSNEAPVAF